MDDGLIDVKLIMDQVTDFDPLLNDIGERQAVLMGEASHGTHEYYQTRIEITKKLISKGKCDFIGVEGDWPDCYRVNRYVKGFPYVEETGFEVLSNFDRWPTWMWANREVLDFIEWLKYYNFNQEPENRVGFYGLDVYSLWDSLRLAVDYLIGISPEAAKVAEEAYRCFEPYRENIHEYTWRTIMMPEGCEKSVLKMLAESKKLWNKKNFAGTYEEKFNIEQNALVAANAEKYYRSLLTWGPDSWNIRDRHMTATFVRLLNFYDTYLNKKASGVIWAHNSHVGDARGTSMQDAGEINLGQLIREQLGKENVYIVGFCGYKGNVIASNKWDGPILEMELPPAQHGSWEDLLHSMGEADRYYLLNRNVLEPDFFYSTMGQRAVGVVYDPQIEQANYVPTAMKKRYDALIYLDETSALQPIKMPAYVGGEPPETYPSRT